MVICLERGANDLHMVQLMTLPPRPIISCFIKIQIGLTFLVPAYAACPGKEAVKRVSVCLSSRGWKTVRPGVTPWAIVWRCLRDPTFSRFSITPTCDRQTDRQTNKQTHDYG